MEKKSTKKYNTHCKSEEPLSQMHLTQGKEHTGKKRLL